VIRILSPLTFLRNSQFVCQSERSFTSISRSHTRVINLNGRQKRRTKRRELREAGARRNQSSRIRKINPESIENDLITFSRFSNFHNCFHPRSRMKIKNAKSKCAIKRRKRETLDENVLTRIHTGLWLRSLQTDQRRNGQKRAYKDRATAITSAMRSWNAIVCMGNRWRRTVERGKSQEHTMIDWNVNEIKQHISREISPLSSPFSTSSEGMIKIRRGGATWTPMDETPDDKSTGPSRILLSDSGR